MNLTPLPPLNLPAYVNYCTDGLIASFLTLRPGSALKESGQMAQQRRRIKHTQTFEERLEEEAQKFRLAAAEQPAGSMARELLLRRAQKIEAASQINQWLKIRPDADAGDERRAARSK